VHGDTTASRKPNLSARAEIYSTSTLIYFLPPKKKVLVAYLKDAGRVFLGSLGEGLQISQCRGGFSLLSSRPVSGDAPQNLLRSALA